MATIDRQRLEFVYSMRIHATSEWRLFDNWDVSAFQVGYEGTTEQREAVAFASFVVVDFDRLQMASEEPSGYADYYSFDLARAVEALLDDEGGARDKTFKLTGGDWPVAMLFMEQVEVVRRFRGQQLGRLIAAEAIATLGRGCDFVLTYPAPAGRGNATGTDAHNAERKALRRYWAGIGFRAFADGYSVLDLRGRNYKLDRHLLRWDALPSRDWYE